MSRSEKDVARGIVQAMRSYSGQTIMEAKPHSESARIELEHYKKYSIVPTNDFDIICDKLREIFAKKSTSDVEKTRDIKELLSPPTLDPNVKRLQEDFQLACGDEGVTFTISQPQKKDITAKETVETLFRASLPDMQRCHVEDAMLNWQTAFQPKQHYLKSPHTPHKRNMCLIA